MARTNSKYFEYRKNLLGVTSAPTPVKVLIANSQAIKIGQMARVNTSGFAVPSGTTNPALGVVSGLIDSNGIPVDSFGYTGNTGHTNSGDDTITTASDNTTRALAVYAEIQVGLEGTLFYNIASQALTQTMLLQLFPLISTSDQVDASSGSDASGVVQLVQLDPDGDGVVGAGLFRISAKQLSGEVDNATAKIVA